MKEVISEMKKEIQEQLKYDIAKGKIWGLRLVKTPIEAIKTNCYGLIFEESREIVGFDEEKFYLKTRYREPTYLPGTFDGKNYAVPDYSLPTDIYSDVEAYYSAFNYYDGDILRAVCKIPAAVNPKDSIKITEYEVIRSY